MEKETVINDKERQRLAQKIWEIPFASQNLQELTKKELLLLFEEVTTRISNEKSEWYELDIKDLLFEQKCWLIECLDSDFFNRMKE